VVEKGESGVPDRVVSGRTPRWEMTGTKAESGEWAVAWWNGAEWRQNHRQRVGRGMLFGAAPHSSSSHGITPTDMRAASRPLISRLAGTDRRSNPMTHTSTYMMGQGQCGMGQQIV